MSGKLGHKLMFSNEFNPAVYRPGATLATLNNYRLYSGWGPLANMQTTANSNYHGLQAQGNKRFSHRFSVQGAYTFSKAIDQTSTNSPEGVGSPNPFNMRAERGLAGFNAEHIASLSWIVDLPQLKGKPAALRLAAGGWQWNGLFTARTGLPLNATLGSSDVALSGTPNQRPNVVGDLHLSSDRPVAARIAQWFNPAAFATPAIGTYGNAGRDVITAPGSASVNAGLFKNFPLPLREGMKVQFRSELLQRSEPCESGEYRTPHSAAAWGASPQRDRHESAVCAEGRFLAGSRASKPEHPPRQAWTPVAMLALADVLPGR